MSLNVSETLVEIANLSKSFPASLTPALQEISGSFPKGKLVGLVGPDGAGKTTLIRLIAGLLTPTSGSVTVNGYDSVVQGEEIHSFIGYMPQKFGLYEDLSVLQNLHLFADLRGLEEGEKGKRFDRLLGFTGLKAFEDRLAGDLSGGMKQKLGLACALIKKPILLLLDEPSVGVDPISRRELWKMVRELLDEGITVLWSTAYLDEAERCDTVLLLNEGKLLYRGDPKEMTKWVESRVYSLNNIQGDRRALLFQVLEDKNVLDGIVQGRDLRFVVRQNKEPLLDVAGSFTIQKEAPRFEDAFMDILGGGPGGKSELGQKAPYIENHTGKIIVAEHLTKKFGNFTAVDDVSLEVQKGEIFGLLGPNGAGKSTTFKMLCGLLNPTSGKALVNGLDFKVASGIARANIGYMAQKFSLYSDLSVKQNLSFFAEVYNLEGSKRKTAIDEMIETFELEPFIDVSAGLLPLGFKQRLSLACANMHHPAVLFLDEPTSGVDPITRREFWNHINGLVQKGVTIMITTHFMDEAEYCDRIALVYRGKIIDLATPNELKEKVKSEKNPNPTLENAFVQAVEEYDAAIS